MASVTWWLAGFFSAVEPFGLKPVIPATLQQLCDAETLERWVREKHMMSVAAAEDLIRLKTGTGRQIDEADIRALRRLGELRSRRLDD